MESNYLFEMFGLKKQATQMLVTNDCGENSRGASI